MKTILVVEDDVSVRQFSLLALQKHGYRTLEACDGKSGLATFLRHQDEVDLTLTDVVMPHPGPEMVEQILRFKPSAKIAFMSGTASRAELPRNLRQIPILDKPFTSQRLLAFVKEWLAM